MFARSFASFIVIPGRQPVCLARHTYALMMKATFPADVVAAGLSKEAKEAKEQLTKKEINEDEFKPRLPTMAELGDVDDDAAAAPPMPMAEGSNRRARRENQKLMKKPPPKLGDSARF